MCTVLYESKDQISTIYLNRPARYNALNKEMLEELLEVVEKVEKNNDKVVVITGNGKAFCAGGDINMMGDFANKDFFDEVMRLIEQTILKLYMMPKIIVSAIQGSAAGLGLSLALTADFVIAHDKAKLGMLFIGIGLAPDGGGHFWIEQRVGTNQAKQFIWSGKQVEAQQAEEMGLINIVTDKNVVEHSIEFGKNILSSPVKSMIQTKMLYHTEHENTLRHYLHKEKEIQWKLCNTKDHQEGVAAFLEKRKPIFTGQ